MSKWEVDYDVAVGCGCWTIIALYNVTIGAVCFQYCLWSIFSDDIPWYGDMFAGFFLGLFATPVAVVCLIARLCGT